MQLHYLILVQLSKPTLTLWRYRRRPILRIPWTLCRTSESGFSQFCIKARLNTSQRYSKCSGRIGIKLQVPSTSERNCIRAHHIQTGEDLLKRKSLHKKREIEKGRGRHTDRGREEKYVTSLWVLNYNSISK